MRLFTRALTLVCLVGVYSCSGHDIGEVDAIDGNRGDSSVVGADGYSAMDAVRVIPDGATVLPDGAVLLPDGALWNPDATATGMDAARVIPDGAVLLPDGAVLLPDGALWSPDATTAIPDGAVLLPDGAVLLPDGALWNPDGSMGTTTDGSMMLSDGGMASCPAFADGRAACGATEVCGNGLDDNCNGLVDERCVCIPGTDRARCYGGCPSQAGVGVCAWGVQTCVGVGEFGAYNGVCVGAGRPMPVVCGGLRDFLCDGVIDEGCMCRTGDLRPCYDGPSASRNVGLCADGRQMCRAASDGGTGWGPCTGQTLPQAPLCDGTDHACTGMPFAGCACMPGTARRCYDGPATTDGVGLCHAGMQSCTVTAGVASWGTCIGQQLPAANQCDGIDRMCNRMPDVGCACPPGTTRGCYDGPLGTEGIGLCHAGMQRCVTTGTTTAWGACTGEVVPGPGVCDGLDHLCNGAPNTGCACVPSATRFCYTGPSGTEGVGLCHNGSQSCIGGPGGVGSSWGPCTGEVRPTADRCDGVDRLCDGAPSAGCTCIGGSTRTCYDGPMGTSGVGVCRAGTQTCSADGVSWGACTGQVLPGPAVCDGIDHLCNGAPNTGCACVPGAMQSCYDGPSGTVGVGLCREGTQSCVAGPGGVGSAWGPCTGDVIPAANTCDGIDRRCDGQPYAGCVCVPGATRLCYSGPSGSAGVGLCRAGQQACVSGATGPGWGPCIGQVLPGPEVCDGMDHLCDGMPNTGCACTPGTMRSCYSGPAGTAGIGLCRAGVQNCISGAGGVGSAWSSCVGEVYPSAITCDGLDHACGGNYPADCPCAPGATRACYTGPAGTAGVGTCRTGTQTCVGRSGGGSTWGTTCAGEVGPGLSQCDGLDHLCAGMLPNCNPSAMCPAPVTTRSGVPVSLLGSAVAVSPATIVSYGWSVISAPSGAIYTLTSSTANPTSFSATSAGVYTLRFTTTDSMGRTSSCSVLVTVTSNSYLGTEFWAVTSANSRLKSGVFDFAVAIGNPNSTTVTVTVSGGALTTPLMFTVPANNTVTRILPWVQSLAQITGDAALNVPARSALATNGAYRISTTAPVSAYEFNPLEFRVGIDYSYTNDASLLLPTTALTGSYIALTHNAFYTDGSFVAIVGTDPFPTTVTVTLSSAITAGAGVSAAAAGATTTYTLNRGDVVELVSTSSGAISCGTQDLTGTIISANHQVAVFAGVDCTFISPGGCTIGACDHLEEQMFPVETWGRDVVVSQVQDRGVSESYFARIISAQNSNTLTFVPAVRAPVVLNRGQFVEFQTTADFEVTGTQPFMVGQYMVGQGVTPGVGDPAFVLEVPTAQYRHDYNFVVPATYTSNFINVTGARGASILLDGIALAGTGTPIAGTTWNVWRQAVAAGSHTIATAGTAGFGLKVLGVAAYTSYMYPGGLDLSTLP